MFFTDSFFPKFFAKPLTTPVHGIYRAFVRRKRKRVMRVHLLMLYCTYSSGPREKKKYVSGGSGVGGSVAFPETRKFSLSGTGITRISAISSDGSGGDTETRGDHMGDSFARVTKRTARTAALHRKSPRAPSYKSNSCREPPRRIGHFLRGARMCLGFSPRHGARDGRRVTFERFRGGGGGVSSKTRELFSRTKTCPARLFATQRIHVRPDDLWPLALDRIRTNRISLSNPNPIIR